MWDDFPPKSYAKQGYSLFLSVFNAVLEILPKARMQEEMDDENLEGE